MDEPGLARKCGDQVYVDGDCQQETALITSHCEALLQAFLFRHADYWRLFQFVFLMAGVQIGALWFSTLRSMIV